MSNALPRLGAGLGYRTALHHDIVANADRIDFLEVVSDQYLYAPPEKLLRLLELGDTFPLIPHGVGLSIGTAAPLETEYLDRLAQFVEATKGHWFSDHLSFTKVPGIDVEQLTPVWFTEESLEAVNRNVRQLKARIPDPPFLLENVTYYFPIPGNDMSEAEFVTRVLEETDTGLLIDVNNVAINAANLGFDPYEFLDAIPLDRVVQMHIAGGVEMGGMIVDTHNTAVTEEVWELAAYVIDRAPVRAVLLEWDSDWPDFGLLLDILDRARDLLPADRVAVVEAGS